LGEHFDPKLNCPTKELYGLAGAIFLEAFFNLTIPQTVEHYLKLFAENDLASAVFHRVTSALIEGLELDVSRQRLDSTHLYSDMATFGRTKLMGVTIKRFLTQLKHGPAILRGRVKHPPRGFPRRAIASNSRERL